ncbi:MAG TPA: CRISPR-associated endonuclease Cas1 [Caulobacteraceae bacterium]|nr:CRISPR-associated endonuclease Cas1 [Caulobacteraceae bacterium]
MSQTDTTAAVVALPIQGELELFAPPADADELLVPARMVNEWVYCPRLAFLEWAHGEWAGNADTAAGNRAHAAAEAGRAPALPAPDDLAERDGKLKTRRLSLASERLGLAAEIDVLEAEDGVVTPVDVKAGKRPHLAEGAWLPERVQVCVQGLLLRDAGYRCDEGALWFAQSRERVRVPFTEDLIAASLRAASELRLTVAAGRAPPPLDHSPKCPRCSLLPICLPDEVNWFRKGAIPRTPPPAARPALPLYVQTPGARVGRRAATLVVQVEGEPDVAVPLDEISELILAGPVGLTTPAMHELLRRETPVAWTSSGFWFLGATGGHGPRSAAIRTVQYALAADPGRRLAFARDLVAAKIRNQRTFLRRNWRGEAGARGPVIDRLALLAERTGRAHDAPALLGVEGEAAALYFRALPSLFTEAVAALPAFAFEQRNRRPPADPVNACLSLAYALLTRTFTSALATVGLDPWKGFFHVERPGRPSLALDLIEPYRPLIADSAVLTALNNGELAPGDFVTTAGGCNLNPKGRRALISAYERRLDQETTHPVFGYQVSMRRLIQVQARLFARWLLGEIPDYPHYLPR